MAQLRFDDLAGQHDGFRLHRLELYNWGTFNQQIWAMEPGGDTALLTGANGSGKSTIVDALLTLLVPNVKRNYNQASGADRRRERDEKSYVRGAYGRVKDLENSRGVVQYLRGKNDYTVLLAAFVNQRLQQEITLAQLFFWKEDELKKLYFVAPCRLNIAEHLRITSTPEQVRKHLKAIGVDVYDEFARYSRHIIKQFRLRSEKALDLFNQTVSIKEIGGLNDFVRQHMLERTDTGEKIAQLRETYQNLTRAHDAIAKAEQQLARLGPLLDEAAQYQQQQERISEAERCAQLVPFHFAQRKLALLDRATADANAQIAEHGSRAAAGKAQVDALRQNEIDLSVAISSDTAGQQLQSLRREIEHVRERRREKKLRADKYSDTARQLNLPIYSDGETFFATAKQARAALTPLDNFLQGLINQRDERKQEEGRLRGVCQELAREIDSLRLRKSRLPSADLRIRADLAQALSLAEDQLPFVGELLKVRDDARRWEGAIERLLRGYGRQMLVPEEHYRQVMGYVDRINLRGRLLYHRADTRRTPRSASEPADDLLALKLEIKPGSTFHDWLKADLLEHWDYVCCETTEQFQRERRALTLNGQLKSGGARHEKDDRFDLGDRTRYVLGWDNRDKIAALEAELAKHSGALKTTQAAIAGLEEQQKKRSEHRRLLQELLGYDGFAAIDWQTEQQRLDTLAAQQSELEASSDRLALLETQLASLIAELKQHAGDLQRTQTIIGTLEQDIARYTRQRAESTQRLHAAPVEALNAHAALIDAEIKGRTTTLDTVDGDQNDLERFFTLRANSLRGPANTYQRGIIEKIVSFKNAYPEDTTDMDATVESIDEFRRLHERISRDDLPTHRKRFKEWLDGKVVDAIIGFLSALEKKVAEYRESIDTLNSSLSLIAYTNATYIRLTADPNREREIQEFRLMLRACIPNVGQRTAEANESSFQRIRILIDRFDKEDRWTSKVTDVRNWLDFAAEERYNEDDSVKDYYNDSSEKSGGQKAKLAYTILASAIAYQYGLAQDQDQARTFRFVVVDEAFSKSDEKNAAYAMDLFKQLNLQLLVVTPLDKTHVVEPYIAACHFVANSPEENDSQVVNLTIQEYHTQKAKFKALVQATS